MKALATISLLLYAIGSAAQGKDRGTISTQIDQDFFAEKILGNEDRNYTQGTSFTFTKEKQEETNILFLMNRLTRRIMKGKAKWNYTLPSSISIGVSAFTPLNIRTYYPEYGDRPYANIVFLSTSTSNISPKWKIFTWDFTYGMVGTNVGKEFQSLTHRMKGLDGRGIPLGWHTQIGQGGQPVFMVKNTFLAPVFSRALKDVLPDRSDKADKVLVEKKCDRTSYGKWARPGADMYYGTELAAGYYTFIGGKIGGRLGLIKKENFASTATSVLDQASKGGDDSGLIRKYRLREVFFYGNFNARLFTRNVLLTGARRFRSGYSLDPDFVSTFVSEWEAGLCFNITNSRFDPTNYTLISPAATRISFSIKQRSTEIRHPDFKRNHAWGCATVTVPVGF